MKSVRLPLIFSGILLAGCTSGTLVEFWSPRGADPASPAGFKHASPDSSAPALPESGKWWELFGDPVLDGLMDDLEASNPDLKAALARVDQAYAVLGITGAQRFPTLTGRAGYTTDRDSANSQRFAIDELEYEQYRIAGNASWEIDLWGRIRASWERDRFKAQAARALYADTLLSLHAMLARQYFALRSVERESAVLREAVAVREEALRLQNSLAAGGAGSEVDVARALTELETVRAEAAGLERVRGKLEHSIAALTGRAPSEFAVAPRNSATRLPRIPPGVPSSLLARRPDLRAAEGDLRASSLQVGITKAEYLPRFTLVGIGGMATLNSSTLFAGHDSLFFSLGPQLDVPVFQAGRSKAAAAEARARWEESVEDYRAILLTAVREVDDSLLDLQTLQRQVASQQRAAAAAARATALAQKRFDQGAASYFEIIDAQRTELQARRTAVSLAGEQAAATVQLVQALGGSW